MFNSDESVRKTINSFLNTSLPVKLILVDNSSTDILKHQLADLIADPRVVYIHNNKNVGFGAAHNIAIRQFINQSKYHLVLNPDVFFDGEILVGMEKYLDQHKDIGLLIPKVVYPDGRLQYVCKLLPNPFDLIIRRFLPASFFKSGKEKFELRQADFDRPFEAPYIHGCFMFLRTEALKKVGLFDERFFMYPEDIDLTRRIHKEYKTMFYPAVSIIHTHSRGSYKSLKLLFIHIINMIKYFNKWGWIFDKERRIVNKRILAQFKHQ